MLGNKCSELVAMITDINKMNMDIMNLYSFETVS